MYNLHVQNAKGEIMPLCSNADFDVWFTGINTQTANIIATKSAGADGSTKNSASLNEKNIVLYIKPKPPVEINRNKLYRFFNAKNSVRIFYKNDLLDVYIDGTVETFDCEPSANSETAQISIICHDPYFKAVAPTVYSFVHVVSLFKFPFSAPASGIPFSELIRQTTLIADNGDVESGMIIEFYAMTSRILNPAFYNRTTQEYISLEFDMEQGDKITINTIRRKKSITLLRGGKETNILNTMKRGSKFVPLHAGENELSFGADEGAGNLVVSVMTTAQYLGV